MVSIVDVTFTQIGNSDNNNQERIELGALPMGKADDRPKLYYICLPLLSLLPT